MANISIRCLVVLLLIAALAIPANQSQELWNQSEGKMNSQSALELSPTAEPVAPLNPEIQYSGDPGGTYSPQPQQAPTGPQTLIVIFVYFSDLFYSESLSTFNSLIFGNVSNYYQEVSYGQCSLSGTVAGWYNLGQSKAYYGADGVTSGEIDDYNDDGICDSWRLVDDALAAADPFVDFSSFGHIMIVHAGNGQESSYVTDDIWSCRWSIPGHFVTDEKTFDSSSIVPETQGGDVSRCIGVIAHEFGHDIGLPDLYDYDHTGEDDFVDEWGLMASGSWNGVPSGTSPAHPMAYNKMTLEWLTNYWTLATDSALYGFRIYDQETYSASFQAIKVTVSPTSYYLVELRSDYGFDAYLPSTGVLISYCDESLGSGEGIVKVMDAHPGTATLDDAAFQAGECFLSDMLRIEIDYISIAADYADITVVWKSEQWIDNLEVMSSSENQYNPDIASDASGNLYIAHEEFYAAWGTQVIMIEMSSDGGRTWTTLAGFGSSSYNSYSPKIVVDSQFYNTIYVVYERETSPTNYDIIGYAYNSSGSYFMYIDTDADNDRYPCITCEFGYGSSNRLYVAYEELFTFDDRDMIVKQSTDKGISWNTVLELGAILDYNVYCDLSITYTVDSDSYAHLYVSYVYGADYGTAYSVGVYHSTNRGVSWMQSWAVSGASQEKHGTSIAAGHTTGTAVVAWHQSYSPTDKDVWIAYSTDNGANWISQWIAYTGFNETDVDVGVDGQGEADWTIECPYFHVVYRVGTDVLYKRAAANRPNSWSTGEVVNSGGSASAVYRRPAVTGTIREDGSHYPAIVWTEFSTPYAIYYSTRGGTITVVTEPAGLIVELDSIGYITPFSIERIAGMTADFYASSLQSGAPGVRYAWGNWIFGSYAVSSQSLGWAYDPYDETIIAHYNTEYYLTITSPYATPSGEGWYLAGSTAYAGLDTPIVPSDPGKRYLFQSWTDDASGTDFWQSDAITMDGPKNATAVWGTQYQWTIECVGDYNNPGSGWVDAGISVYFYYPSAPPANSTTRFIFDHWSGDVTGTNMSQSSSIVVTGPILVYAHWTTQYYILVVTDYSSSPSTGWYNKSSTITVSVNDEFVPIDSESRWRFDSWSGNATGSVYSASDSFLVDSSKTIYANWQMQYLLTVDSAHSSTSGAGWYDSGTIAYAGLGSDIVAGVVGERFVFQIWTDD
ncbi:MAG: M6 family metalloprotease domain-containing protein, partial [Candidatus Sifarchaeia archaeon]